MTGHRSTCDLHPVYNRDCTACRARRRAYQADYRRRRSEGPTATERTPVPPTRTRHQYPKSAPSEPRAGTASEVHVAALEAQLDRLRSMEESDPVYREMLASADARHLAATTPQIGTDGLTRAEREAAIERGEILLTRPT